MVKTKQFLTLTKTGKPWDNPGGKARAFRTLEESICCWLHSLRHRQRWPARSRSGQRSGLMPSCGCRLKISSWRRVTSSIAKSFLPLSTQRPGRVTRCRSRRCWRTSSGRPGRWALPTNGYLFPSEKGAKRPVVAVRSVNHAISKAVANLLDEDPIEYDKYRDCSSHTFRRGGVQYFFYTLSLEAQAVAAWTGHKSLSSFYAYISDDKAEGQQKVLDVLLALG